jgi:hypothetical protein
VSARRALPALALVAACLLAAPGASANPSKEDVDAAQRLFDEGLDLLEHGHAADACPKLEESQRLDPGMGTEYRLAECYAATGRLVRAVALFREVAADAKASKSTAREHVATQRADDTAARIPKLVLELPATSRVPGLAVRVDDAAVALGDLGKPMPLDPGDHSVSASAPGYVAWSARMHLDEGIESRITIPRLAAAPRADMTPPAVPEPVAPKPPPAPPATRFGGQRIAALAAAGVGVAGVAVGTVFGLKAKSNWSDALSHCRGGATDQCDATGVSLGGDAKTEATISTISFVVGGVGLAGAAILFFTAPRAAKDDSVHVAPIAGAGTLGAACTGVF